MNYTDVLYEPKILFLDVETTVQRRDGIIDNSPFNKDNKLVSIHYRCGLSWNNLVFYHDDKDTPDDPSTFKKHWDEAEVIVAHNAKFDIQWLFESGFTLRPDQKIYCTMIGEYILARGQRTELSLAKTAERYNVTLKKSDLIDDLFKSGIGFEKIPLPTVIEYAEADVLSCQEIYFKQQRELSKNYTLKPTFDLMNEMLLFLVDIEKNGIYIDSDALRSVELQFLEEKAAIELVLNGIITEIMGDRPINLHSGQDMTKVIYSRELTDRDFHKKVFRIGLDPRGKPLMPPKMQPSTFLRTIKNVSQVVYKQIASHCRECDSLGKIQKYKKDGTPWKNLTGCSSCKGKGAHYNNTHEIAGLKLSPLDPTYASINGFKTDKATIGLLIAQAEEKNNEIAIKFLKGITRLNAISTYLNSFVNGIKTYTREDNILHASFNQCVTATGRLSSSHPNFQNQPKSGKFPVRKCIVSRFPGGSILEADYSGLEFRVAGELSGDQQIIDDIKNGKDIHTQTAMIIHKIPKEEVTKDIRSGVKFHSFAPLYGSVGGGQRDHIKKYYEEFFNIYSGVKKWHDELVKEVIATKIIRIPSGREFTWKSPKRLGNGRVSNHTQVVNYPVQSLATADYVPLACIRAYKLFKKLKLKSKLILTVHDSIVVDVHPEEEEKVKKVISFSMLHIADDMKKRWNYTPTVPLDIEIQIGKNWMEMDEIVLEPDIN